MTDTRPTEQGETRRQIAESIARRGVPYSWLNNEDDYRAALNWFANEIEAALKDRDERAAKIVNDARFEGEQDLRSLAHRIRNEVQG